MCKVNGIPMNRLGVPLGLSLKARTAWNCILGKRKCNFGVEVVEIAKKGEVDITKKYSFQFDMIPTFVANRLENLQREFSLEWRQ